MAKKLQVRTCKVKSGVVRATMIGANRHISLEEEN